MGLAGHQEILGLGASFSVERVSESSM